MNSIDLPPLTGAQNAAAFNAHIARTRFDAVQAGLAPLTVDPASFNDDMALAHDCGDPDAFFSLLGSVGVDIWDANGLRIGAGVAMGRAYTDYRKPPFVCIRVAGVGIVRSTVPFPAEPLAVWHIPAATREDALALIAQGTSAILDALLAAQPA